MCRDTVLCVCGHVLLLLQAQPGDFISKVADAAVIRVGQLLLDNNSTLKDLDKPLEGTQLLLCDPDPTSVTTGSKPTVAANSSATNTSDVVNRTAAAAVPPVAVVPPALPGPAAAASAADEVIAPPVVTSGPAPVFPTKAPGPTPSEETAGGWVDRHRDRVSTVWVTCRLAAIGFLTLR